MPGARLAAGGGRWQAGRGAGKRAGRRTLAGLAGLPTLARRHWLFTTALGLGVVIRAVVMAGFAPAALFKLDTYDYLWDAAHLKPNPVNPSGYAVFLWLLRPFHSLVLVAAVQHLMGLFIAVLVYAVLRRWGVAGWVAALAAAPVLFDPAELLIEQLIMADIVAMFLMIAAFAVVLARRSPSTGRAVTAAVLMGASAVVRPSALPLIAALAVYLLIRRTGWRTPAAALGAGLLPVAAYVAWFAAVSGSVGLTSSDGMFLWSRTMSFANCAVIKPPPSLQELCPGRQPGDLAEPVASLRPLPKRYLWNHGAWQWQPRKKGLVPDTAAFTPANNARARDFAVRAIKAQTLDFAKVVAEGAAQPFVQTDRLRFPGVQPRTIFLSAANRRYMLAAVRDYLGSTKGIAPYLGTQLGTRLEQPYARLIQGYQDWIFLPGKLFGLILLIGLAGLVIRRTRTAAGLFVWVAAAVVFVLPVAEHEYTYRYVIPAVPLACLAAALTVRNRQKEALASPGIPTGGRPPEPQAGEQGPEPQAGEQGPEPQAGEQGPNRKPEQGPESAAEDRLPETAS
jgi:Dolichyl-phosphate-mannose-protein mannosyltransferase